MILAKLINLALLVLFPFAWAAPLARAEIAWIFETDPITILSGIVDLWEEDVFLSLVVALFAVALPYAKTLALAVAQFSGGVAARRMLPVIELLGRFSMTDVFLIAFYVIAYRGIGDLKIAWGTYFFTALVLASIWASWMTARALRRAAEDA